MRDSVHRPKIVDYAVKRSARKFLTRVYRITHRVPMRLREVKRQKVLVIAPHSDDEVIGAGGTLALHQECGSDLRVLFVASDESAASETEAARRMVEARRVADLLGFDPHFLGLPDTKVSLHEDELAHDLRRHIETYRPDVIICPFPGDHHRDHQATAAATIRAVNQSSFGGEIWCYEIWSTLWPNTGVDIERVVEIKRKAINLYESQTHTIPYADAVLGLNRYRGLRVYVPYAEAFYVCHRDELTKLGEALSSA